MSLKDITPSTPRVSLLFFSCLFNCREAEAMTPSLYVSIQPTSLGRTFSCHRLTCGAHFLFLSYTNVWPPFPLKLSEPYSKIGTDLKYNPAPKQPGKATGTQHIHYTSGCLNMHLTTTAIHNAQPQREARYPSNNNCKSLVKLIYINDFYYFLKNNLLN